MTAPANQTTDCFQSLQACRIRVARLTAGGGFVPAPNNVYVTDAIIDLQTKLNVTKGDQFKLKDGCGTTRATYQGCDSLDSIDFTLQMTEIELHLWEMLTGGILYISGGNVVGYEMPSVSAACPNGVSLELWTRAWNTDQQATNTGTQLWWHWVWPKTTWVLGDKTFGNDILKVPLVGHGVPNANALNGPYKDWPATVGNLEGVFLDTAIPAASCGYISRAES